MDFEVLLPQDSLGGVNRHASEAANDNILGMFNGFWEQGLLHCSSSSFYSWSSAPQRPEFKVNFFLQHTAGDCGEQRMSQAVA